MTHTPTHCHRCGRTLTAQMSRTAGYGPGCRARIRHTTSPDHSTAQDQAARELIEDGGIIPIRTSRAGIVYRTVATDGASTHLTTAAGHCTCPAGHVGRRCYHVAAARLVTRTRQAVAA